MADVSLPTARYDRLDFNSPLSAERASLLLAEAELAGGATAADLGCGWGELLLRALEYAPGATGDGVDTATDALDRGRRNAEARGLADRATFHAAEAASWDRSGYDLAICIGSSHAWPGGTDEALAALRRTVRPGGRVIFGDGFWERLPTPEALDGLAAEPEDFGTLAQLVDRATAARFVPLLVSTASRDEWEVFESRYCGGLERWLLANPDHPDAVDVREAVEAHRNGWLRGYRNVLGLAYLVLAAT
jgi:SAM-dependent methyltransferase